MNKNVLYLVTSTILYFIIGTIIYIQSGHNNTLTYACLGVLTYFEISLLLLFGINEYRRFVKRKAKEVNKPEWLVLGCITLLNIILSIFWPLFIIIKYWNIIVRA